MAKRRRRDVRDSFSIITHFWLRVTACTACASAAGTGERSEVSIACPCLPALLPQVQVQPGMGSAFPRGADVGRAFLLITSSITHPTHLLGAAFPILQVAANSPNHHQKEIVLLVVAQQRFLLLHEWFLLLQTRRHLSSLLR
jgi:hypothetical protein